MHRFSIRSLPKRILTQAVAVLVTAAFVITAFTAAPVAAYTTAGALGRSLDVYSGFTINRNLLAPLGSACRSGQLLRDFLGVTIHETSNWSADANALMHAKYLQGSGQSSEVSWHYAVDDKSAYESVPEYEKAWHAGDGGNGNGNARTIAIEICDNANGNFDQAMANAEWLAADVLYRHGIYTVTGHLFQHHDFSSYGKNCPITIRDTGRWAEFSAKTQGYLDAMVAQSGTGTPILMTSTATVDQAKNWAAAHNASATFIMLADLYWELAPKSGVNPVVAYAQAAHETGFGRFGGVIDATYCNPCGLKTSSGGDNNDPSAHQRFSSWREGVQAHIDHLALYAGQLGYPKSYSTTTPDPRHFASLFGTARTVEALSGKWAPSATYSSNILTYISQIQTASTTPYLLDAQITNVDVVSYSDGVLTADITALNTGSTTWDEEIFVRLGFGLDSADSRATLPAGVEVNKGESYTFRVTVKISDNMKHRLIARIVQDGVKWIGLEYSQEVSDKEAKIVSVSSPASLMPGESSSISITVENTGLATWTGGSMIRLGADNSISSDNRVYLPAGISVQPGQTYTFTQSFITPTTAGNVKFAVQMVEDGVAFFGESRQISIPVKQPTDAQIVSVDLPDAIQSGAPFTASITIKNTDSVTWSEASLIRLGVEGNAVGSNRVTLPAGVTVAPGGTYTFAYTATAPTGADLSFTVQMIRDGVTWFGESRTVKVAQNSATITAVTSPDALLTGQTASVDVTVKNTGLSTWSPDNLYRLATDNSISASNRYYLPSGVTVAPGASYTFHIPITAPNAVGTGTLNLRMVQDGVAFFGENRQVNIPVKAKSDAAIESVNMPDSVKAGQSFTATVVVKNTDTVTWTEQSLIRLGVEGTATGPNRVTLPSGVSVLPGAEFTFTYTAVAPTSGDLILNIRMIRDGVAWFGDSKTVSIGQNAASILSTSAPSALLTGQTSSINVTVKNTGLTTWTQDTMYRLASDNCIASTNRSFLTAGASVAPGQSFTFTVPITAPASGTAGVVNLQMVRDGVTFFGDKKTVSIPVKSSSDAEIVSIDYPEVIAAGGSFTASITVKNTDTVTWSEQTLIRLGVFGNATGPDRVKIPNGVTVAPGATYTFLYSGTAPTVGDLTLTVRMVREGVAFFGETQSATYAALNAKIAATDIPQALIPGQQISASVTMKNIGLTTWTKDSFIRLATDNSATASNRYYLPDNVTVKPGEEYTFVVPLASENTTGNANLNLQMVQDGVKFFGASQQISIPMKRPSTSDITSVVVPTITANTSFSIQVTVMNTDTVTWTPGSLIRLGVEGNAVGNNRVVLPAGTEVKPGQSYTFTYTAVAPQSGTLQLSIQMVQDGVAWFGETQSVSVPL